MVLAWLGLVLMQYQYTLTSLCCSDGKSVSVAGMDGYGYGYGYGPCMGMVHVWVWVWVWMGMSRYGYGWMCTKYEYGQFFLVLWYLTILSRGQEAHGTRRIDRSIDVYRSLASTLLPG